MSIQFSLQSQGGGGELILCPPNSAIEIERYSSRQGTLIIDLTALRNILHEIAQSYTVYV